MSDTIITVMVTREDIIKIVQDKAKARGLDVSPEGLVETRDPWGGINSGLRYGIHVQTIFDDFPEEAEETTLAGLKCYFSPVVGITVQMVPAEVK